MNDLVTSPEDPTIKYKEDAHCTRSTSFKIVCVSKLAIHDRNRFEGAVNYLIAQQKHTRSKQTQKARLAQLVKGWTRYLIATSCVLLYSHITNTVFKYGMSWR